MSSPGVPWAGIVMTSVVFVFGAVLNALTPDAFEIALEAAAIGVVFTWGTIFACQLRLRQLVEPGVIPASPFQMPGSPYTSYIGLAFLVLVDRRAWPSPAGRPRPYFWHKTDFLVVVFGIPILAVVLCDRLADRASRRSSRTPATGSRRSGRTTARPTATTSTRTTSTPTETQSG